jgi:hypothetical protein
MGGFFIGRVCKIVGDYRILMCKLEENRTLEDREIDGLIIFN